MLAWFETPLPVPGAGDCGRSTWSETSAEIAPRAVLTERARKRLADMVNVDGDSIAGAAAGSFGVGWHTANQAVADHTDPLRR